MVTFPSTKNVPGSVGSMARIHGDPGATAEATERALTGTAYTLLTRMKKVG
jgi:hypothetical protein